jgi:hypothetical protein
MVIKNKYKYLFYFYLFLIFDTSPPDAGRSMLTIYKEERANLKVTPLGDHLQLTDRNF